MLTKRFVMKKNLKGKQMNKKLYTILYVLISTVLNVVVTILVIAALFIASFAFMRFALKLDDAHSAYPAVALLCFLAGIIINFFINKAISTKLIIRFGMDGKFEDKWFSNKKKKVGVGAVSTVDENGNEQIKETRLPSSVLPDEEEIQTEKEWGK